MPILRDLSYARTRSNYVPLDLAGIEGLGAGLQQDYEQNKSKADLLLDQLNQLRVRDVNTPILENTVGKAKAALDQISQQGDYENADLQLKKLAYETANDPLLKGALEDYATYTKYQEELKGLKDTPEDRKRLATGYSNATNNKMVEYDPVTGYKNIYSGYTPGKVPDVGKTVGDFISKMKASTEPIVMGQRKDGTPIYMGKANNGYYVVGEREGIGDAEAMDMIKGFVQQQPEIQSYLKENLMFDKFQNKYDPQTGEYKPYGLEDFGVSDFKGEGDFYYMLAKEGHDPSKFQDPAALEKLYDQVYLDKATSDIANPFAKAASYNKTNLDYKTNQEWLNSQQFAHSLQKMKAEEAKDKRMEDYKADKEKEKEKRQQYALSNPVESEPVNLQISEEQLANVNSDLKVLQAKKEAAMKGSKGADGQAITFSPQEQQKLVALQADKRLLEHEGSTYVNHATESLEGEKVVQFQYTNFVKSSGNKENISYQEFKRRLRDGDIKEPKMVMSESDGYAVPGMIRDPNDVNTFLWTAKQDLGKDTNVQKAVNKTMTLEANGLFAWDEGSNSEKSSALNKVKTTLYKNVMAQGGVGYDVVGAGQRLNDVLAGQLIPEGEPDENGKQKAKYKGKNVEVTVIPLNRNQKGVTDEDVMYQMVIKEPGETKALKSFRIRPQDQQSHADLNYALNKDLAANHDESTVIGKDARMGIINYELPQFKPAENRRLLDAQVNDRSPAGSIGVGQLIPFGKENWTFVKSKTPVIDHFDKDDPNAPVTVMQEGYHLVRLKDNLPPTVQIDANNIDKYTYHGGSVYDDAILNERQLSTDNLKQYGAKRKDAATLFSSIEDGLQVFHAKKVKGQ
jgi:hypothetical protein